MIKQSIIIYNLPIIYNILNEMKESLNFKILNYSNNNNLSEINEKDLGNYLILTKSKNNNIMDSKQLVINKFPIKIDHLIEKINLTLLKIKFSEQSNVKIKEYYLNINSRELSKDEIKLKLTEKEVDLIIFLKNTKKKHSISDLQKHVWGHITSLETHTVETHIYRLRKKIVEIFNDQNFIKSEKKGYKI
tara:strand:- start:950 stop:1519 length:570 start_codon:yes stop_codon:yes gene_type:complete